MAAFIRGAKHRICYAAPGLQLAVGQAIREAMQRLPTDAVTVKPENSPSSPRGGVRKLEYGRLAWSRVSRWMRVHEQENSRQKVAFC